ncbi:hypothetical protein RO3G_00646 [Rhizopus delemar RA 99-880]|uniref:Uncharacterized protein n=1 Tax=Rhizopus delemar (strain RA 99-880 / ATCC MYA-4621 / FGSC 9543 / NRRL 43880) TaxID=246409 RepID=I1BIB2_RHIO9|nr:hypothetical protein RO3G_00646 [Rhizopus delemar RA 99-880]|eukprot:EIE75942.1 hypothetical protein RO3G_00646 [Rhizopus delemar RA 99-880]
MQLEEDKPHSTNAIKALENSNGTQEMPIHESSRGFFDVLSSRISLQVPIPCIWVKCNSKDFLETYEICRRASQENGSSSCPLPGQHLYSSQGKGTDDEPYPTNDSTLGNIGFLINKDKSTLIPNKVQSFLGFQFNTQHMTIQATTIKIQKLETRIRQLFKVWNIQQAITHVRVWDYNEELDVAQLQKKTVVWIGITAMMRPCSALGRLQYQDVDFTCSDDGQPLRGFLDIKTAERKSMENNKNWNCKSSR